MPVQGGAADIIKRAMLGINARLQGRTDALMTLQVHDELVFEVRSDSLEEIRAMVVHEMEAALPPEQEREGAPEGWTPASAPTGTRHIKENP
jgi:DNA polymerase I-like protein with 3'-5' exonuclease and polymerase domains